MILLVTGSKRAQECAAAIARAVNERTETCHKLSLAARSLRSMECSVVVIDEHLVGVDPPGTDLVLKEAEAATPVFVNFAICGIDRVVRDVRSALERRKQERTRALREAESHLQSELTEDLTGILLSSQLALEVPGVPTEAQTLLRSVNQLATRMRQRLDPHTTG
jgi:hypothetical protein